MRPAFNALFERVALAADALVGLPAPYPGAYMDVWLGLIRARTLISATRLGIFDALPGTAEEVAARCGCDPARLEVLLQALCALRYVRPSTRVDGARHCQFRLTRRGRRFFGPDAALRLEATVGSLSAANWDVLTRLEDVMRGADPPGLHDGAGEPAVFAGYQAAMVELNALVLGVLLGELGGANTLLDVGGGPGSFAAAACAKYPGLRATVADFEDAALLGRERIAAAGLTGRIDYRAGDARTTDLGGPYDVVTLNHVLHNVDRATGIELLAAAGRAGGRVVVCEIEGSHTQVGTLASVAFTAWMGSRAWTGSQLRDMAREAGLRDVDVRRPARVAGSVLVSGRR